MKVSLKSTLTRKDIKGSDVKIGQLVYPRDTRYQEYFNHILLCTYSGFVSLTDPSCTWTGFNFNDFDFELLLPEETVMLNNE